MSDDREDERFLSRWSRLKKEARQEAAPAAPPQAPAAADRPDAAPPAPVPSDAGAQAAAAPAELPPIESLAGLASDYRAFLRPGVDEALKRAALKKLFSDPHFTVFEKFEAYCEDYTKGEPIPEAMLRTLEHAKDLLFREEKQETAERPAEHATPVTTTASAPAPEAKPETPAFADPPKQA
jgi:hypothetical protein